MTGFFVKGEEFDLEGPEWAQDPNRPFYTAGRLEQNSSRDDFYWMSDHTLVTDTYGIALLWAMALVGALADGEHPKPLARVVAHRTDPVEVEPPEDGYVDEDEERIVAFVTPNEIFSADDAEGKELAAETYELGEIIKTITVESED
jgi:hypothetical protein